MTLNTVIDFRSFETVPMVSSSAAVQPLIRRPDGTVTDMVILSPLCTLYFPFSLFSISTTCSSLLAVTVSSAPDAAVLVPSAPRVSRATEISKLSASVKYAVNVLSSETLLTS